MTHPSIRVVRTTGIDETEVAGVERSNRPRSSTSHLFGRFAATGLLVGSLALSVLGGAAGAATNHLSFVVTTTKNAKFGTILVRGKTVYTLKPSKVACTAQCLKVWPEVLLPKGMTKAKAGPGVNSAKLGTVKRKGGLQVTYRGRALYFFIGDTGPGQVHGNVTDKWGKWSVVVTVKPATTPAPTAPTTSTTAGNSPTTSPSRSTSPAQSPSPSPTSTPTPTTSPATPATSPPATSPPATTPPATTPPTTSPPTTSPPPPPTTTTTAPGGGGVGF